MSDKKNLCLTRPSLLFISTLNSTFPANFFLKLFPPIFNTFTKHDLDSFLFKRDAQGNTPTLRLSCTKYCDFFLHKLLRNCFCSNGFMYIGHKHTTLTMFSPPGMNSLFSLEERKGNSGSSPQ
jgi:hypothetical protein